MPYSVALLDQYLGIMSRQAFDLDYMNPGFGDGTPPVHQEGSQVVQNDGGPQGAGEA
jgi:hypothetical protein